MVEVWQALALGGFAGAVNYLQRFAGEESPTWKWTAFAVKVFTGSFVGFLASLLTQKHLEPNYVLVAIAISSYGGPVILDAGVEGIRLGAANWLARSAKQKGE